MSAGRYHLNADEIAQAIADYIRARTGGNGRIQVLLHAQQGVFSDGEFSAVVDEYDALPDPAPETPDNG